MTDTPDPDALHDPRDAAAYWCTRAHSGQMDTAERARLERWRLAHPQHDLEYRRAVGLWNATRLIPANRLRALAAPAPSPAPVASRRRLLFGLSAGGATALAGTWMLSPLNWGTPAYAATLSTTRGQRQPITLPDASQLVLNTATTLQVALYPDRREVLLDQGEALFTVTPDPTRPFLVRAANTQVRVTGTRFAVRHTDDDVQVVVSAGAVAVQQGRWWSQQTLELRAGQGILARDDTLQRLPAPDIEAALAWQQGRVMFRDTPLAQAIAEINRYTARPIRLRDASLGQVRIAGAFSTEDIQGFLALLPAIAPVQVLWLPDGTPVVTRSGA